MVVKDLYQSGIDVLIDGFKALMEGQNADDVPNYGAKSNTMFDHCQITFLVTDIRGVEIITLKKLANKVRILNKNPFTTPKKMRPTIFSNEYPNVMSTEEYKKFTEVTSAIVQKTNALVEDLPDDIKSLPAVYMYNFAGSVSFDAFVTFEGSNLVQLLGVFPAQGLKDKDGSWIDPSGQYFINKAVASFKKIYYDALEGIFGTVDMQTDVALEKMYFNRIRSRDMSALTTESTVFPNILYARAIHPMGEFDLLKPSDPKETKQQVLHHMEYADSIIHPNTGATCFEDGKSTFLLDNTTFIIYAECTIQTLIMLSGYTNIVSYYTDMKNVLGVTADIPPLMFAATENGIRVDGETHVVSSDMISNLFAKNAIVTELRDIIEKEKSDVLNVLRKYQQERNYYEDNRFKNTKMRPPKSMIQRKEYYNMVPLYAKTCCVLRFTKKDVIELMQQCIPFAIDGWAIVQAMRKVCKVVENYLKSYDS